jgi:uncharacterized protein involved in exopolysaccharide biosynthesis
MAPESPPQARSAGVSQDPELRRARHGRWTDEEEAQGRAELPWYVRALQRRWILAVAGAALGGALFFGLASRQRLMYEGVTTLLVVPPSQPGGAQMNLATFRVIVENATLASQIIEELKLEGAPHALTPQAFVQRALVVQEVRGTNVVRIAVTLADPQMAAEASRLLAQKAVLLTRQISQREGNSIQEQLNNHVNDARDRLQQVEQELLSYQKRAQIELVQEDTAALLKERGNLLRLVVDIERERASLAAAELEIKRQQPLLSVARAPAAEDALRRQLGTTGELDPRQLDLTNPFVNPVYQTLDFQIALSRTRIAALERERDELINVKGLGGTELVQLSKLYQRQIEQARLQASLDLARRVHDDVALRYAQSRTTVLATSAQVQVVDQAQPPDHPVSRKRLQNSALGSAAGFLFAVLLILLWESRGRRGPNAV